MFSMSFDGHGNFVGPHLDTLHTTAASLGAGGYQGVWDADLNRDMPWMRAHEQSFAGQPGTKRVIYIEGCTARKVLARVADDGRVLFTASLLEGLSNPQRRRYIEGLIKPDGRTIWFSEWEFLQSSVLKTSLGKPFRPRRTSACQLSPARSMAVPKHETHIHTPHRPAARAVGRARMKGRKRPCASGEIIRVATEPKS
jgi:hypothetical protein